MGSKYSTVVIAGYNSSPPADDGTQTAANQVKWSTIKTKLPDPLKTAIESINSGILTALDFGSRQISASDTTVASDHMKTVEIGPTVSTAITVSLGDAATMAAGYIVTVKNSSANSQTIGRITAGDKIDNVAANVTIPTKGSMTFKVANTASEGYLIQSRSDFTTSIIDAAGDLIYGTAADTAARLAIGTAGQTLRVNAGATAPEWVSMSPITNSLGANVALNNTANYFDGPSIAQGTAGTWFVSGSIVVGATAADHLFGVKLWDGTTLIASTIVVGGTVATTYITQASLSGYITNPAGNLRMSVRDFTGTTGQIYYSQSGLDKDCTITAIRIV